jgi:hypothetical protein
MSEYGVVRRHRGDGSAGYLNKAAGPQKNLRIIYAECSYQVHHNDTQNFGFPADPTADPSTINIPGQYGGPIQWTPSATDSAGLFEFVGFAPEPTEWGWWWNLPFGPP